MEENHQEVKMGCVIFVCGCVLSHLSHIELFVTPWTVVRQAPQPMGFSSQEHWSGLPCPPPRDLPDPGIEPLLSLRGWQVGSLPLVPPGEPCSAFQTHKVNAEESVANLGLKLRRVQSCPTLL